jgi:hypothetical protein
VQFLIDSLVCYFLRLRDKTNWHGIVLLD